MSWTDDIRCLYCDGRLPLYRKITHGQFCSSAHRKAYWQEQERLGVERLHQTHDSLRAYRPAVGTIEAILGHPEVPQEPERPRWMTLANTGQVPVIGFLPDPTPVHPHWLPEHLAGADAIPADCTKVLRRPIFIYRGDRADLASAGLLSIPLSGRDSRIIAAARVEPNQPRVPPVYSLAPNFAIDGDAMGELVEIVREEIPDMAGLLALLRPAPRNFAISALRIESQPLAILLSTLLPVDSQASLMVNGAPMYAGSLPLPVCGAADFAASADPRPLTIVFCTVLPVDSQASLNVNCAPMYAGSVPLPVCGAANFAACAASTAHALDLRTEKAAPELTWSTPPVHPRLRLAAGSRYAVRVHKSVLHTIEPSALPANPAAVFLPERSLKVAPARNSKQSAAPAPMQEPNPAGLVALPCTAPPSASASARMTAAGMGSISQPWNKKPMRPRLRAEPVNEVAGPTAPPDFAISLPPYVPLEVPAEHPRAHVWAYAIDFWNRAPRDLKMLAVAIPVLLGLALHPALPKVRVSSPANTTGMQHSLEQAMNTQWTNVRQSVVDRAAIALDEDFRTGLDNWASRPSTHGEATAEWSFDATGFVRPGPLALYTPSAGLTDYQMQFLGMIDKKALSWVVRAADFDNFYVVKLEVLKPGPLPSIGLTRYAVVNGKADSRVDTVVPIDARSDTLYRVRMDIHGDDFVLTVQGQMVDAWSEPRLKHGGIGFFSARGEDSRVRWVQVTHQYDMLGRLCAYLAPYNISSSSGSFEP